LVGKAGFALMIDYLPARLRRLSRRRLATPYASGAVVDTSLLTDPVDTVTWRDSDPLRQQLLIQTFESSLPTLLRYADRSSMAWSREVRLPLRDRRIAEFALSLPASDLYADGVSKRILRDAGRGVVPDTILDRRDKVGFEPPQRRWLASEPLRGYAQSILLDGRARGRGLY